MKKFIIGLLAVVAVIFAIVKWGGVIAGVLGTIVTSIIWIVFVRGGDI